MKTRSYFVIISILVSVIVGINQAEAYGGPAITGPYSALSQISASGDNVYLTWSDYSPSERVYHTVFRASNDAGKSFGHIISIGNNFNGANFLPMASQGNNVYVVQGSILKKSTDGGYTFDDLVPISSGNIAISNIVATENYVYLTEDNITNSGNGFEILFVASNDNETTFGKPIKLFGMPESSEDYSQVAASGSNVYVVGEGKYGGTQGPVGILYRASRDGGATFSDTIDLSGNNSIDYAPKVATEGNYVYVAWSELASDKKNTDLIFRVSSDSGETFGPKITLNQDDQSSGTYNTDFIQLLAYNQLVYVKWWDVHFLPNGTEQDHLMFKRMPLGDATIGDTIDLTGNNVRQIEIGNDPAIAVGANSVYAIWPESMHLLSAQKSIFLRTSMDGGFGFGNATDLNNIADGRMYNVQIEASGNNVYVAGDTGSSTPGIFFGASHDNGKTFDGFTDLDAEPIPEFPFAVPILLISMISIIAFFRMKSRQ